MIMKRGGLGLHYLIYAVLARICCFYSAICCKIISEHSLINDIISQLFDSMLSSLSKNRNTLAKNPNFLVFSSAHHDSNRFAANQSVHQYRTQNQPDRNHTHQHQPKMFKIRTFVARSISGRQPKIQGRKITQDAVQCGREDNEVMIHKAAFAQRRISIQGKENHCQQYSQRNAREQKYTESVIFREIQILRKPERHQMNFKSINFSEFGSLAHKPHIWHNPERLQANHNAEYVMIVSSHFICLDPKKAFKGRQRAYNSQKSIETATAAPEFTMETESILRNLCGTHIDNFFQHCKIYFKVNSYSQLVDLREYLQANQLNSYDGIIDIHGKYTETHSFYRIQEIIRSQQKLILLEEETMLKAETPFIEGSQTFFLTLTGKSHTQTQVNKILNSLKQIQTDGKKQKNHESHKKNIFFAEDQKENCHPNLEYRGKQQYYKQTNIIIDSNKKLKMKNIYVASALKTIELDFDWSLLTSKAHQAKIAKKIKGSLRQNRNGEKKHVPSASMQRLKRQKARNPSADNKSFELIDQKEGQTIILQGDFKDKMVKYVKILESERTLQAKPKEIPRPKERQQQKADDLDELTANLTSRTKSKTPIQIVGDLLRNNSHIARQISKYLNQARPLEKIIEDAEETKYTFLSKGEPLLLHTAF